jgi:hypothetical protein
MEAARVKRAYVFRLVMRQASAVRRNRASTDRVWSVASRYRTLELDARHRLPDRLRRAPETRGGRAGCPQTSTQREAIPARARHRAVPPSGPRSGHGGPAPVTPQEAAPLEVRASALGEARGDEGPIGVSRRSPRQRTLPGACTAPMSLVIRRDSPVWAGLWRPDIVNSLDRSTLFAQVSPGECPPRTSARPR